MTTAEANPSVGRIVLRRPARADAAGLRALVNGCPPLDVNSTYAYLLVCTHFAETSVVAEREGQIVGFVSAYLDPRDPETVFVWQVAVAGSARGQGLGRRLLEAVLRRPACAGVRRIETTITPSNGASWKLFRGFADEHRAECEQVDVFHGAEVGGSGHEEEQLLRIGPLVVGSTEEHEHLQ